MTITEIPAEAHAAVRLRRRREIDELDYRRELRRLTERGYSQREVARWLGISQPSLSSALRTASRVAMPVPGFSGASPLEICQRYAAGLIQREQLVDELTRWAYARRDRTDGYDSLVVGGEGTWADVELAAATGLIEGEVYDEVFQKRTAGAAAARTHGQGQSIAQIARVLGVGASSVSRALAKGRGTSEAVGERVFFRDVKPYEAPASLDELAGPDGGVVELAHEVLWAPGGGRVDLDEPGGTELAYQALLAEGTVADQVRGLNRARLVRVWGELMLPVRVRALWEGRFPELAATVGV